MYKHIMVPLDGSELAECVLGHVVAIAKGCKSPKVTLVRVVPPPVLYGDMAEDAIGPAELQKLESYNFEAAQKYIAGAVQSLKKQGLKADAQVLRGSVVDSLAEFAEKAGVDLIVIATHGRSGVSRWVMGSVADRALRTSKVPVLMVRPVSCMPVPPV